MERASTTAKAEFCIPVSIEMVRLVRSENPSPKRGTKYPTKKPTQCNANTDPTISGTNVDDSKNKEEFWATTPPQIILTKRTDANGVNLDTFCDKLGALALTNIPKMTGMRTLEQLLHTTSNQRL